MSVVHFDGRKWPDRLHWQFSATRLGEDEHGIWLHVPSGTIAKRGPEPARPLRVGFVSLVPAGTWWIAEFYLDDPQHSIYVNIGMPAQWDGDRVTQIDLDLDVVRNLDGSIEVLDEDEFADHQVRYGYPNQLIAGAEAATVAAVDLLTRNEEPFDSAATTWLDSVRRA